MASIPQPTSPTTDAVAVAEERSLSSLSILQWVGILMLAAFVFIAAFPGVVATHDPLEQFVGDRLQGPSGSLFFGTDELGRDIFSRVIYGTRVSLLTAALAVVVSLVFGVPMGLISGYVGGNLDEVISRTTDLLLSFPGIIIAMTIIAITGRNPIAVAIVIGIVSIPAFIRIARAYALKIRNLPYVDAVRSAGASDFYIMFRTILPNMTSAIYVQILLTASRAIVIESSLSFLGLGVPPPSPTLGAMLSKSRSYFYQSPTYGIFPGLLIALLIITLQLSSGYLQRREE